MDGFLRLAGGDLLARGAELSFKVLGRRILVRRAADGTLVAFELACRHQNADLTGAPQDGDVLTCPRHGWRYDLRDGRCLDQPWAALRRFEVRESEGQLWLSTKPTPDAV